MLRRVLFVSTLMLVGAFGFASSAKADTEVLTFTGTVNPTCNLSAPSIGAAGLNGELSLNATGDGFVTPPTGVAMVGINCAGGDLSISIPASDAGNPTATTNTAMITTVGGLEVDNTEAPTELAAADNGDAIVSITATAAGALAPGDYSYTVTVTAVP